MASRTRSSRASVSRVALNSSEPAPRSIAVVSVIAPLWAALLGLVVIGIPVVLAWVTSMTSTTSWTDTMRITGVVWVVAHAVPFTYATTTYSLLPLGLLVIPGLLLWHSGKWVARSARIRTRQNAFIATALSSVVYAIAVAVIAALASSADLFVLPTRAGLTAFVVCLVALGAGALRASGVGAAMVAAYPPVVRSALRAFCVALASLVALAALLILVGFALSWSEAVAVMNVLNPGVVGGIVLVLLQLAYLPVLAIWAIAFAAGPGFAIAPSVVLSPFAQAPGVTQLPPVPMLAALPEYTSAALWLCPLLVLLTGVVAGWYVSTRVPAYRERAAAIVIAGIAVAVVMMIACFAANGALGDVRLAGLGPSALPGGLAVGGLVIIGGLAGAIGRPKASGKHADE